MSSLFPRPALDGYSDSAHWWTSLIFSEQMAGWTQGLSSEYQLPSIRLGSFADASQGQEEMLMSMLRLRVTLRLRKEGLPLLQCHL